MVGLKRWRAFLPGAAWPSAHPGESFIIMWSSVSLMLDTVVEMIHRRIARNFAWSRWKKGLGGRVFPDFRFPTACGGWRRGGGDEEHGWSRTGKRRVKSRRRGTNFNPRMSGKNPAKMTGILEKIRYSVRQAQLTGGPSRSCVCGCQVCRVIGNPDLIPEQGKNVVGEAVKAC